MRLLLLAAALAAGGAHAQPRDPCADAYNAEVLRIERDLKAQPNDGSEAAKQRVARMKDSQVRAAASRRRQCQEAAAPAASSGDRAADCNARAKKYAEETEWRYGRREMTSEERAAYYEEARKNREWRVACLRGEQ